MPRNRQILRALTVAMIAAAAVLFWLGTKNEESISESWVKQKRASELADELCQTSDGLTRMAGTYAVTDDERYRQRFAEILDIRNGAVPRPVDYHLVYWDIVTAAGPKHREAGERKRFAR